MRTRSFAVLVAATALVLSSCQLREPKRLNGRHRQPVNAAGTVVVPAPAQAGMRVSPDAGDADPGVPFLAADPAPAAAVTRVFRMHYATGSSDFRVPADVQPELLALSQSAHRILIKGRTDGASYSAADERVALERALRARQYLIAHGVDATRISIEFASAADYLAENTSDAGRARNRRVEIQLDVAAEHIAQR